MSYPKTPRVLCLMKLLSIYLCFLQHVQYFPALHAFSGFAFSTPHRLCIFLSILSMMKLFVKDFCETVQARVVVFDMQFDNGALYRGITNQPSPFYSSLYLSDFLSIHILNNEIFRQRFL